MLNENYKLSIDQEKTFIGDIKKEVIGVNTNLYRFITGNHNELMAECWFNAKEIDDIIQKAASVSDLKQMVRSRFAIKEKWNPNLEWLLTVKLTQSVYGWTGKTRSQSSSKSNLIFFGQGKQYLVPNLSTKDDMVNSAYARIVNYKDVREFFFEKGGINIKK